MKFHKQLFRHDPENGVYGDCDRTAIACLVGLRPEEVPHWGALGSEGDKHDEWLRARRLWLASLGLASFSIALTGDMDLKAVLHAASHANPGLPFLLVGTSRTGCNHVVICRDGEIIHDPSLDDSGIVGPASDGLWWLEILAALPPVSGRPWAVLDQSSLADALRQVKATLTVPAAEYVPAIPAAWAIIDQALEGASNG